MDEIMNEVVIVDLCSDIVVCLLVGMYEVIVSVCVGELSGHDTSVIGVWRNGILLTRHTLLLAYVGWNSSC